MWARGAEHQSKVLLQIGLQNTDKGQSPDFLHREPGPGGFTAAARSVLALGADPAVPGRRILAHAKSNLGPLAPSLSCRVEEREVEGESEAIPTSRLVYRGEIARFLPNGRCLARTGDLLLVRQALYQLS